jgi:hypothetical protein
MIFRFVFLFGYALMYLNAYAQVDTGFENTLGNDLVADQIPDSIQMNRYYDSLLSVHNKILLTGYTYSIFNEASPNVSIKYSFTGESFQEISSDRQGRFFIPLYSTEVNKIFLKIRDNEFQNFDSILTGPFQQKQYLQIQLSPRHKIVVRGRLYIGSLATENIDVTIIHKSDTTNMKTLGCYTDNENFWNCLYRGMFKHTVIFDNPDDSIFMLFKKPGFIDQEINMKVSEYDGSILPIKLVYSDYLPQFPEHNISLNYSPPISGVWSVGINYTHMLKFGEFKRLGLGFESKMLISEITSDIPTFPNVTQTDSIRGISDSTYTSGMFMPHLTFWLTKPERRFFSLYAGIGFPFTTPNNKFYFQPFMGGRFYLDINKALVAELKYVNYQLDVVEYKFNPYGDAFRSTNTQTYNRLMINFGLQISF